MPEVLVVNRNLKKDQSWLLETYRRDGGYAQAERALRDMSPDDLIELVTAADLKGRGGAFFPTGLKWKLVRGDPNTPRYVVVNGDESEPGTYCNRLLMEDDPHGFIEGMIVAAYAVDSHIGYIYIQNHSNIQHFESLRGISLQSCP